MFLGEYEHTLDDKHRLTLPARYREAFSSGCVVTRGMDGCLFVFTKDEWERFVGVRLGGLDPLDPGSKGAFAVRVRTCDAHGALPAEDGPPTTRRSSITAGACFLHSRMSSRHDSTPRSRGRGCPHEAVGYRGATRLIASP